MLPPLWLKDPLAVLAEGAERGLVVQDGRIVELVPAGREPATAEVCAFAVGAHVLLPGLINTHHHFYQTLTRATPLALDKTLFPWLAALYPIWARLTPEALESAATVALAELLLSGCTTTTDHHYVFPAGLEQAIDIEVAAARRLGIRVVLTRGSMNRSQRDGGLPPDAVVADRALPRSGPRRADADRARAVLAVLGHHLADARDRRTGRALRRAPAHASGRDRGRDRLLSTDVRPPAAGLPRRGRLAA
jgi:8-oxoguanine deaminase